MAVRAIHEETRPALRFVAPDDVQEDLPPAPKPRRPEKPVRQVIFPHEQIMTVLSVLIRIIATRVIMMLAGIGAFALALAALGSGTVQSLIASAIYDLTVFLPCLYLTLRRE